MTTKDPEHQPRRIRVLIADDHPLARFGIANELKHADDVEVVGEAEDGKTLVKKAKALQPDVITLDLFMPELSGFDAIPIILTDAPGTRILVLTAYEDDEFVQRSLKAGVQGYVLKSADRDELLTAVRMVAGGKRFFSRRIEDKIIGGFVERPDKKGAPSPSGVPLTRREVEILLLIAEGKSTQEIADKLYLSNRTVDTHRANIMQKLDVHDIPHLVRYAIEKGIVDTNA